MKDRLLNKLRQIREDPNSKEFIIADAKDGDMAMGVPTPGQPYPPTDAERFRSMMEYHEEIRKIVQQGIVDIMLAAKATTPESPVYRLT